MSKVSSNEFSALVLEGDERGLPSNGSTSSLSSDASYDYGSFGKSGGSKDFPRGGTTFRELQQSEPKRRKPWFHLPNVDPAALQFALRMAVLLTISALFVLIQTDDFIYPDGMWVLVSVLFVCWFPSMDAASVIEKITQRLIGTFIGATLGLSCGFISLWWFKSRNSQATFIGCCLFIFNFVIIFLAGQCKVGETKVIRKFAYATILCVLTFCICCMPFALNETPHWEKGVMRVVNVIIGCFLGAIGAIAVCPKSTMSVLHDKTARQVKLCGEASEALLHMAADHFGGKVMIKGLAEELMTHPLDSMVRWKVRNVNSDDLSQDGKGSSKNADVALKKYEDAIADWKASKMLFPLTKYDPFHILNCGTSEHKSKNNFNKEIARTLARSLRIQTTIVMLDGLVRHDTEYNFAREDLQLFREIGTNIHRMLTLPLDPSANNTAALALFSELETIRNKILLLSEAVSKPDAEQSATRTKSMVRFRDTLTAEAVDNLIKDDDAGRGIPKFASEENENSLFFFQLVEHLILRSLRLYQAWKQVEVKALQLKDKSLRVLVVTDDGTRGGQAGDSLRSLIGI